MLNAPPFRLEGLDHVVLRVRELQPMLDFYCRVLGCTLEKKQEALGLWQLRAGSALIDLLDCGKEAGAAPAQAAVRGEHDMDHFCLRVSGYDETALRAWLDAQGARAGESGRRYGAEGMGPSLYVYDPQGNRVELKGPPERLAPGEAAR